MIHSLNSEETAVPKHGSQSTKGRTRESTSANLGFEAKLWQAADALRNNMDAAEYKHVVLGLIFLKYISDAFEAQHAELESQRKQGADPEDPIRTAFQPLTRDCLVMRA